MNQNKSLLLLTSENFKDSSLIDNIHLTYIDIKTDSEFQIVEIFINDSQAYLEKDLPFDVANELFVIIATCFSTFPKKFLSIFEDYLKKSRLNANYIIVNSFILFELVYSQEQLKIPDFHSFVDDALKEISDQIKKSDNFSSNFVVFGHKIQPPFIGNLILNLILISDLDSKLISNFLPFLYSHFHFTNEKKFYLFIEKLSKTDLIQILPQTEQSNREIIDLFNAEINSPVFNKMGEAAISLVYNSAFFIQSKGKKKIKGLNKENILLFLALFPIIYHLNINDKEFSPTNFSDLILEGTNFLIQQTSTDLSAAVDLIFHRNELYNKCNLIDKKTLCKMTEILIKGGFKSKKNEFLKISLKLFNKGLLNLNVDDMFKYFIQNITEAIKYPDKLKIDINNVNTDLIIQYINQLKTTDDIDNFFHFFRYFSGIEKEKIEKITDSLINLLKYQFKEKNYNAVLLIVNFFKTNNCIKKLQNIDKDIGEFLFNLNKNNTVDEIISHILADPEINEEANEALFNKMIEDKELLRSYLLCSVFKYRKVSYQLGEFEKMFTQEYEKYGEDFIFATNRVLYYQDIKKILIKNPDFKVSNLPISESGFSIVSKLFTIIKQNPYENYQAFFCLKNIACCFPFLFAKSSQQIFELVLSSLSNFSLIFERVQTEKTLKLAKTSYSAFEFLFSTLQSTIVFDDFIKWFFNINFESLTNSQVYAFILLLRYIYKDEYISIYFQAFLLKYNFLETVSKFLEREVKEEYFTKEYKHNIYQFLNDTYDILNNVDSADIIFFELINKCDFPVCHIYENIYLKIPFTNQINLIALDSISKLREFIYKVHKSRKCWLNNSLNSDKVELDAIMIDFDKKLEKHVSLPPGDDKEVFYPPYSIKMIKYFFDKPSFIFNWCIKQTIIPVVQELYQIILETIDDLTKIKNNSTDDDPDDNVYTSINICDATLPFFCQNNLFKIIINNIPSESNSTTIDLLTNLFIKIGKNDTGLLSLFKLFSEKITDIYNNYISTTYFSHSINKLNVIFRFLYGLSNLPAFKNNFIDLCGKKLLNICLLSFFRSYPFFLSSIYLLLTKSNNIPNQAIYLAAFMLLSRNNNNIIRGLNLLKFLDQNLHEIISSSILLSFDNLDSTKLFVKFAEASSIILNERRFQLIKYIDILLDEYSIENDKDRKQFKSIGYLFTQLSPTRGKSLSCSRVINESSTISSEIMAQSPFFWQIYEKHQSKILEIIGNNPELLDSFKFLLEYPELISFAIRSSYFRKKMREKISNDVQVIRVNIYDLLSTSFQQLQTKSASQFLNNFYIVIEGEGGDGTSDAGGVTRQWFTKLAKAIFDPNYGLFQCTKKLNFFPSPNSNIHSNHLKYFHFAGRFVARAIIEGICIDAHFTSSFLKQILHRAPKRRDLADVDEELFTNFEFTLSNENVEQQYLVFAIDRDEFGSIVSFPLKENGEDIEVTNENKKEYVDLYVDFILRKEIEEQINAFVNGFDELIHHDEIKMFTPDELDMIICGIDNIDVDDLIAHTIFGYPYTKDSPTIKMFLNVLRKWDNEKLTKLLFFMTGATHLPPNGFKGFCENSGHYLTIQKGGEENALPQGHTCFNAIDLPEYPNEDVMNEKLLYAIYECDMITNY